MGYTHYWTFKSAHGNADKVEKLYQQAIKDCQKIVSAYNTSAEGDERLSGYSAHTKPGKYGGVMFNGKRDNAHEDFVLREHYNQNESFNFCKTAHKPYDVIVVACLVVLQHRLGRYVKVSSDGGSDDWAAGTRLARLVLGIKLNNPIREEEYAIEGR